MLSKSVNVNSFNIESGYLSFSCSFLLDENLTEIFDGLPEFISRRYQYDNMILMYIAAYIALNDSAFSEAKLLNETTFTIKSMDNI